MSGGSFNYLYAQEPYTSHDLEDMADELRARGMYDAEKETRALIPSRASKELSELWHAVEWHRSCDWSEAQVAREFIKYEQARIARDNPPG